MKSVVITPRNENELKVINQLINKLGLVSATMSQEDIEDLGLSRLLKSVDKTKKVSRESILHKLQS